jgi:GNAT superfamily N-acetyltransferase
MSEPVDRVAVTVTFLRMDAASTEPTPPLPPGSVFRYFPSCSVEQYRSFYNTVGQNHLWWLRRSMSDRQLATLLADPRIAVHSLEIDGRTAGFYELDSTSFPMVNLSYFGLFPDWVGTGIGLAFLRHVVDAVWKAGARVMTVNTCTADNPRALPTYKKAGFRPIRVVREEWNIPQRLGMPIPDALRI